MRKIFDDLTYEEIVDERELCIISITRKLAGKPFMVPVEVSAVTADKIKRSLIETANRVD